MKQKSCLWITSYSYFFSSAFLIVGGILSINGKALDDDDDNTSLPDPIQGIAEATGIKIRWY